MIGPEILLLKIIAVVVAAVCTYLVLVRRLADLVQPYRLRLAELGEEMLGSGDLTPGRERQIRFYLDNAFNGWIMTVAALAVPFVAIFGLTASLAGRRPPRVIEQDDRTSLLFALSVFAANPLFGTIVAIEIFIFGILLPVVAGHRALIAAFDALMRVKSAATRFGTRAAA